ncbi:MAG: hypothetical protein PHP64_00410, partial [Actinomycetota bacterium]|nr:hypothetical protein [Actinomycetota bacterium]
TAIVGAGPLPHNGRWSVRRKSEVVLRMLSGESINSLSRELRVEPYRLETDKQSLSRFDCS